MAGDFAFEKGASFGEWFHEELHKAVSFETEAWALDRVQRVDASIRFYTDVLSFIFLV